MQGLFFVFSSELVPLSYTCDLHILLIDSVTRLVLQAKMMFLLQ